MTLRDRLTASWRALTGPETRAASPENPNYSLTDPAILDMLGIGDSVTAVSPHTALQSSVVFSCVKVLAESLAQLPIRLYRLNGTKREIVTDHPVAQLLGLSPNPIMTRVTWLEQQQAQLALWGNAYSQRVFDRRTGRTVALYPLPSGQVTPIVESATDPQGYPALVKRYRVRGEILSDEDIVHIPLLSLDGIVGMSPIQMNRLGVGLSLEQQRFANSFYTNGTRLTGVLEHPQKLSAEAGTRLRENWTATYAGGRNAGKVAILEEGMKFNTMTMPLADAQFIETAKMSREQIAAIFRIPPHMIGNLDKATFSNIEHQSLEFAVFTLGPYLTKWEQALAAALLSPSEQRTMYFKFNLDALLRGDIKSRYDAYAVARQWGWLSVNEIRDLEERNPVDNGEIYLQPVNMVEAGEEPEPDPNDPNEPKEPGESPGNKSA